MSGRSAAAARSPAATATDRFTSLVCVAPSGDHLAKCVGVLAGEGGEERSRVARGHLPAGDARIEAGKRVIRYVEQHALDGRQQQDRASLAGSSQVEQVKDERVACGGLAEPRAYMGMPSRAHSAPSPRNQVASCSARSSEISEPPPGAERR